MNQARGETQNILASLMAMICTWLQGQRCIVSEAYAHLTEGEDARFTPDTDAAGRDIYHWQRLRLRSRQAHEGNYSILGEDSAATTAGDE